MLWIMLKFVSSAVLYETHGLYAQYGREEVLDSHECLIGTEQHSCFAQSEIAGAAAVSEEIEVEYGGGVPSLCEAFHQGDHCKRFEIWQQPFLVIKALK